MDTEPKNINVSDRIRKLIKEERESGELVETPFATFRFKYLSDPQFQQSFAREQILQLQLPELVIANAKKAIDDLGIHSRSHFRREKLEVRSQIPNNSERVSPAFPIAGEAFGGRNVELYFDPNNPNVVVALQNGMGPIVAHELNHIARYQYGRRGQTLLDEIINEGLAVYYAVQWSGRKKPWPHLLLTPEQEREEWETAQQHFNNKNWKELEYFVGKDGKHLSWRGYALGAKIVSTYFANHTNITMKEAVRMDGRKILRESHYSISSRSE